MLDCVRLLVRAFVSTFHPRARLKAENLVLRHQLNLLQRARLKRPRLTIWDQLVFVWVYRLNPGVLTAVRVLQPGTIVQIPRSTMS
jgi:hypothetical protein